MSRKFIYIVIIFCIHLSCGKRDAEPTKSGKIICISSITIIADLVKNIGGDKVESKSICETGVDPHTFKPRPADTRMISESDIVFINGLGLEHWIEEMIGNAGGTKKVVTVTRGIEPLTDEKGFGDPDPHMWFNVNYVKIYARNIMDALVEHDIQNSQYYEDNLRNYTLKLDSLDRWVKSRIQEIPEKNRMLVTSHDAFRYFGNAYGLEVNAVQGISTEAKPQTKDVTELVDLIKSRGIKAVFIETSVNPKLLEEISRETGAVVGGTLYSDSLGDANTPEGTYIGAVTHNVNTIVNSLK